MDLTESKTFFPQQSLSKECQLQIGLMHLRQYLPDYVLSCIFRVPKTTIQRTRERIVDHLFPICREWIQMGTSEQRKSHGREYFEVNCTVVIDGSEQPICESQHRYIQDHFYSAKKKQTSITTLVACTLDGKIVYIGKSNSGSVVDIQLVKDDPSWYEQLDDNEWVLADSGIRVQADFPRIITKSNEIRAAQLLFSSLRIVIENVFAHLKFWKVCSAKLRSHLSVTPYNLLEQHQKSWTIIGGLYNRWGGCPKILDEIHDMARTPQHLDNLLLLAHDPTDEAEGEE